MLPANFDVTKLFSRVVVTNRMVQQETTDHQIRAAPLRDRCPVRVQRGSICTQAPASITARDTPLPISADKSLEVLKFRANFQLILTAVVTVFGLLSLTLAAWVFTPSIPSDLEKVVRLFIVIVFSAALVLITGGYSNERFAPAFRLRAQTAAPCVSCETVAADSVGRILGPWRCADVVSVSHQSKPAPAWSRKRSASRT
jgi:hypothetical protein